MNRIIMVFRWLLNHLGYEYNAINQYKATEARRLIVVPSKPQPTLSVNTSKTISSRFTLKLILSVFNIVI